MSQFVTTPGEYWEDLIGDRSALPVLQIWADLDDNGSYETEWTDYLLHPGAISGGGKLEGAAQEAVSNTWAFTLDNVSLGYSAGDHAYIPVLIKAGFHISGSDDVVTVFVGYVDDRGARRQRGRKADDTVTFRCIDRLSRAAKTTMRSHFLVDMQICDPDNPSNSIFHFLADKIGFDEYEVECVEIPYTKDFVEISDGANCMRELQSFAAAYTGDLRINGAGALSFTSRYENGYSDPTFEWQIGVGDSPHPSIHSLNELGAKVISNRVRLEFSDYELLPATLGSYRVVYKNTKNYDPATDQIEITVAAGEYWPGPGQYDVLTCSYKDPQSSEHIVAKDVQTPTIGDDNTYDIWCEGGNLTLSSFNGSDSRTRIAKDGSQMILYNGTGSTVTIRQLRLRGTGYRTAALVKCEAVDASISEEWKLVDKKLDGKYVANSDIGRETCEYWMEYGKSQRQEWEVETDWLPQCQEGALIRLWVDESTYVDCKVLAYEHRSRAKAMRSFYTTLHLRQFASFTSAGAGTSDTIDESATQVDESGLTVEDLLSRTVLGGGDWSTATWEDAVGGADWDTGAHAITYLGGMAWGDTTTQVDGDLLAEDGTIHASDIQILGDDGRLITIDKTNGFTLTDGTYQERQIKIGTGNGILATDSAGNTIHDIPVVPLATGFFSMGHLYMFDDDDVFVLDEGSPTNETWITVTAETGGNEQISGALLFIEAGGFSPTVPKTRTGVELYLRPKGTSWGSTFATSPNTAMYSELELSGAYIKTHAQSVVVPCAVDGNAQFEYFFRLIGSAQSIDVAIKQLGFFI